MKFRKSATGGKATSNYGSHSPRLCSDFVTTGVLSVRAKTTSIPLNVEAPRRLAGFQPHKAGAVSKAIQFPVFGQPN